jgi:ribose 5-phosphate isomerase A
VDTGKKASPEQLAAIGAIAAEMVGPGDRVGLGSGRAALAFVRALGARLGAGKVQATGVATSLLTEKVARESGIPLATLAQTEALDLAVDGADEVDPDLNLIKGGGGNLTREKVVASISRKLVIVVGEEKLVARLGTKFPVFVEVVEFARPVVIRKLQAMGARVEQRMNGDGTAFLTDNGNPYLHCWFDPHGHFSAQRDPAALDQALQGITGIVETGIFLAMAGEVIVARVDGSVERMRH